MHSIAGLLDERARLVRRAPLQAPHHTASVAALVGGGSHLARPGAISLAHHGVLFLDEASEFCPRALDALRQPLEKGYVVLHRGGGAVRYPARFQLVLAANPCPCAQRAAPVHLPAGGAAAARPAAVRAADGPHRPAGAGRAGAARDLFVDTGCRRETSAAVAARVAAARAGGRRAVAR